MKEAWLLEVVAEAKLVLETAGVAAVTETETVTV